MIISRTPFRISFTGGSTDLKSFYEKEGGAVVSTTIDKYMYITVNKRFDHTIRASYSKTEIAECAEAVERQIAQGVEATGDHHIGQAAGDQAHLLLDREDRARAGAGARVEGVKQALGFVLLVLGL